MLDKPWGHEEIIVATGGYIVKRLTIHPYQRLSLQKHLRKTETLIAVSGKCHIIRNGSILLTNVGGLFHIPSGVTHRIESHDGKEDVVILEVSTTEQEDVVRLEDDYGRCDA